MPPHNNSAFVAQLTPVAGLLESIGRRFADHGYSIALVGGPVRDAMLGRWHADSDLDFTTDARPDEIMAVLAQFAEATWDIGIKFGTVGSKTSVANT